MIISETFTSIQGEGHLAGKMQHFIRSSGCSVACPIRDLCDEPDSLDGAGVDMTPEQLAEEALAAVGPGGWVCLTGGEPTEQHDFGQVCAELRRAGLLLQIQTSGVNRVDAQWDWLTVSPKTSPTKLAQRYGHELKIIYQGQGDVALIEWFKNTKFWNYYLQPLWGVDGPNLDETIAMVHRMNEQGIRYDLSTQAHKAWGVR